MFGDAVIEDGYRVLFDSDRQLRMHGVPLLAGRVVDRKTCQRTRMKMSCVVG